MTKINLYTEDKENIPEIVSKYFDSFTMTLSIGYWKGQPERSIIISVVLPDNTDMITVRNLAKDIRKTNNQEAVLIEQIHNVQAEMITKQVIT